MYATLPRGPIDTQICVPEFCPLHIEEKRAVSKKVCFPKCVPHKQGTFQNCARVAENCARVAQNCDRVADVISVRFPFPARNALAKQKPSQQNINA